MPHRNYTLSIRLQRISYGDLVIQATFTVDQQLYSFFCFVFCLISLFDNIHSFKMQIYVPYVAYNHTLIYKPNPSDPC